MVDWEEGDDTQCWTILPLTPEDVKQLVATDEAELIPTMKALDPKRKALYRNYFSGQSPNIHWSQGIGMIMHD